MQHATVKSYFWKGARAGAPFLFMAVPFAMLFGVLAAEAGFTLIQTMTFSISVFAGAAQFTALHLMQEQAPTVIVLISSLAVNLRVAMYSATLTPYLGGAPLWQRACAAYLVVDQSFALSIAQYESDRQMNGPQRLAYFFGTCSLIAPAWYGATLVGALVGTQIPDYLALDFIFPIAFLGIVAPMLRTLPHVIAAGTASVVALAAGGLPFNLGLIVAGTCGMMAGAQAEVMMARTKAGK
ncbi:MAG: AzlC family ABC transporter permease [Rhodobacteraceae bacterium]|nr:AzlC family ABC transporter permease [Paracoccaceae bacterium]